MTDVHAFNAYLKWLGIPVVEQPPNHYRLLGIETFENDFDVIEAAAEQRMGFLRKHQSGPQAHAAVKLLNEVSAARLCLLNPQKRSAYNAQLRAQLKSIHPKSEAPLITIDINPDSKPSGAGTSESTRIPRRPWTPILGTLIASALLVAMGLGLRQFANGRSEIIVAPPVSPTSKNKLVSVKPQKIIATTRDATPQASAVGAASETLVATSNLPAEVGSALVSTSTPPAAVATPGNATIPSSPPTASIEAAPPPAPQGTTPVNPPMSPASDPQFDEARLQGIISQLEKSAQTRKMKLFNAFKARLIKIKSKLVGKKALSPQLDIEYTKLIAACDRQEFLPLRVSSTISFGNHDYAYVEGGFTWNAARERCESLGGHLATLNTDAERDFIVTKFLNPQNTPPWLGGFDQTEEGVWRWVTGEPWQFWANIDNEYGQAHSLTYWKNSGGFHDTPGNVRLSLLCEWESRGTPEQISLGSEDLHFQAQWDAFFQSKVDADRQRQLVFQAVHEFAARLTRQGQSPRAQELYRKYQLSPPPAHRESYKKSEYAIFREAKTWNDARRHCVEMGGHLVIFDAPGERDFAFAMALRNRISLWIGHSDEHQEGVWRWVDNTLSARPTTLSNQDHEHAGWLQATDRGVTWHDQSTELRSAYLCEWEIE